MPQRVLVIDENLNPRIARELRNRGRHARAIEDIGLKGESDGVVIEKVFALYDDAVLVTGDDTLPAEYERDLARVRGTVATIAPWNRDDAYVGDWGGRGHRNEDEWDQEIVHRWAHLIELQPRGSVRRYRANSYAKWTAPRRSKRRKARS